MPAPLFLDIEALGLVLHGSQILVEKALQLLSVVLLAQTLLADGRNVFEVLLRNRVFLLVRLRSRASSAFHEILNYNYKVCNYNNQVHF